MADAALPNLDARPKGGFLKKMLVWLVMALILGGGGFGAGYYLSGGRLSPSQEVLRLIELETASASDGEIDTGPKRVPKDMPEAPIFETRYHEFPEPLTTNLKGSRRFLQIGVGISTQYDESVIAHVETHAMALRSDMLAVISGFAEEDVEGTAGREALAEALKTAINTRLTALEGFGGIEGVFFPTFVLQ